VAAVLAVYYTTLNIQLHLAEQFQLQLELAVQALMVVQLAPKWAAIQHLDH
jgi:hypothetical protein